MKLSRWQQMATDGNMGISQQFPLSNRNPQHLPLEARQRVRHGIESALKSTEVEVRFSRYQHPTICLEMFDASNSCAGMWYFDTLRNMPCCHLDGTSWNHKNWMQVMHTV